MTSTPVAWDEGSWTNPPVATRIIGDRLVVSAVEGSDYWERTQYGFQHGSGHALLAGWDDRDAIEVTFTLDSLTQLYDQAGLMLWHGQTQWIKAGVELNDGVPHLGAVVTNEYSDWSLSPVPEWAGAAVTIRASRSADAVIIRARADAQPWRTVRVARFPYETGKQAGPFTCAPTRAGLEVTFTRWVRTSPDMALHTDPPA